LASYVARRSARALSLKTFAELRGPTLTVN
jgi:hypothetical protein